MVFRGGTDRRPGTLHRVAQHLIIPSPVDAVGQFIWVGLVCLIPSRRDRRQSVQEIRVAGIILVGELGSCEIFGRNHGWFDDCGWQGV